MLTPQRRLDARRADSRRRMLFALVLNGALLVAELIAGIVIGSLALLADAGHLLSDVGSIGLGLLAATLAGRPGGEQRTFGYQRTEVLAALVNGLTLVAVAVLVAIAAVGRLGDPPEVEGAGVLALGLVGLAVNALATVALWGGERSDLNLEGVLRHSFADALGSLGVVAAGAVLLAGGPPAIDPAVSLVIAVLILASSWRLISGPFEVLLEAAPAEIKMGDVGSAIGGIEGVREVHDLHVWTLTPGFPALAAHVVVVREADRDLVRRRLELLLAERFGIDHTTLQMEVEAPPELLEVETDRGRTGGS